MNKSYDVYMCRNEFDEDVNKLESMIFSERYGDASKFLKSMRWKDYKWKSGFCNAVNRKPLSSPLRRDIVLRSITKLLNGEWA